MAASALRIEDFADDFDPFTALLKAGNEGHVDDPYPAYDRLLRHGGPVQKMNLREQVGVLPDLTMNGLEQYAVLGFDAVSEVLMDAARFPNAIYRRNLGITFGDSVTVMDGAEHARYRKLFQSVFTPKTLAVLKPRFQAVIDRLVARFESRGKADLLKEFSLHFPFQFIMDLMGMDVEQRPLFHKIAMAQMCVTFDHDHGERLPENVMVSFFRQLMNAGGDTSYHGFSNILAALFNHPEQLDAVRKDRKLIAQAIDEGLRWSGPIGSIYRGCAGDTQVGGVTIPEGVLVTVGISAANRDYTRWQDAQRFDIFRPMQRHVAFGYGPHVCIGQHLARMELQMALNTLLDRFPDMRLDADHATPRILGYTLRGAEAVQVKWS